MKITVIVDGCPRTFDPLTYYLMGAWIVEQVSDAVSRGKPADAIYVDLEVED